MRVRMIIGISGGRHDGREWPAAGHEIDVPDHEGDDLIRARHAIYVGPSEAPGGTAVPPVTSESSPTSAGPSWEDEHDRLEAVADGTEEPEPVPEPKPGDLRQAWVDYAVSQGATEDQANGMTKVDLMSRYGGRL